MSRGSHLQQLQRFVKEIAQLEDVYFVTMRQLLAWMKVRSGAACGLMCLFWIFESCWPAAC